MQMMLPSHGCQKLNVDLHVKTQTQALTYILVLVDSCVPGDMVTITGIVKVTSTEERKLSLTL